jgi:ATP-dependent phosphoenolpyruvate carboxykinase
LFVHDGAVGSHTRTDARVRVITDDANVALYMRYVSSEAYEIMGSRYRQLDHATSRFFNFDLLEKLTIACRNIIHPIPLRSPLEFNPEIVVYVSPSFPQKELADAGFTSESGAAVDLERGVVLVAGPTSFENIRNAVSAAATYKLAK